MKTTSVQKPANTTPPKQPIPPKPPEKAPQPPKDQGVKVTISPEARQKQAAVQKK